jgi:hypothetical protein
MTFQWCGEGIILEKMHLKVIGVWVVSLPQNTLLTEYVIGNRNIQRKKNVSRVTYVGRFCIIKKTQIILQRRCLLEIS